MLPIVIGLPLGIFAPWFFVSYLRINRKKASAEELVTSHVNKVPIESMRMREFMSQKYTLFCISLFLSPVIYVLILALLYWSEKIFR